MGTHYVCRGSPRLATFHATQNHCHRRQQPGRCQVIAGARAKIEGMQSHADRLLDEALSLTMDERAKLARELLASMDGEPDPDVKAAWADETARREQRALSGQSQPVDWASVREEAISRLRGRE